MLGSPCTGIHLEQTGSPAFGGHAFGAAGRYVRHKGVMRMHVDPQAAENAGIALLDRAPRDAGGLVRYDVDLEILTPEEPVRGNGWLFYDVLNRGTKRAIQRINTGPMSNTPESLEALGNRFLLERGFTLVWTGWQGDVPEGGGRMAARLPVAGSAEAPVTGLSREEFILDSRAALREDTIIELAEGRFRYRLSYPRLADSKEATLTWRLHAEDARDSRRDIAYRWIDEQTIEVTYPVGIDRGGIFEFIYCARDPMVMGLGLAAIRDSVSALRHSERFADGSRNPIFGASRRAIGFGLSQSGRVLRDFLHQGFNRDGAGRPVFDGVIPIIAGGRGAFLNRPFAQPGRFSRQHEDHDFPGDQFPFAYQDMTDPASGRTDGILRRAVADGVCPKVMHMDTDSEYWSARASLVVTDFDGRDAELPEAVRVYHAASVAHGDYELTDEIASAPPNKLTYGCLIRAMVAAMTDWVDHGKTPPPSRHPRRDAGTLVPPEVAASGFPEIPGTRCPDRMNGLRAMDHENLPPSPGPSYRLFVPAVDADGNSLGGVLHPLLAAPVRTHTGWQIRRPGFAEGDFFNVFGSSWPIPETTTPGDSRTPLDIRYPSVGQRLELARRLLDAEMRGGYLLAEDRDLVLAAIAAGGWTTDNFL